MHATGSHVWPGFKLSNIVNPKQNHLECNRSRKTIKQAPHGTCLSALTAIFSESIKVKWGFSGCICIICAVTYLPSTVCSEGSAMRGVMLTERTYAARMNACHQTVHVPENLAKRKGVRTYERFPSSSAKRVPLIDSMIPPSPRSSSAASVRRAWVGCLWSKNAVGCTCTSCRLTPSAFSV
jgi:hypothetical protein